MTMATLNDVSGELTLTKAQRALMLRCLGLYRLLAKLGDKDAETAIPSMEKVVAKHPVEGK
jgi:hypothetical protein